MAYKINTTNISMISSGDLSANQYRFIDVSASGQAALCGDGANAEGVLQDIPSAQGQVCAVAISGVSKVVASGAIALGANVASGANGKAKVAASGNYILGTAQEEATADGQIIAVLLNKAGRLP